MTPVVPQNPDFGDALLAIALGAALAMVLRLWLTTQAVRHFPHVPERRRNTYVTLIGLGIGFVLYFLVLL